MEANRNKAHIINNAYELFEWLNLQVLDVLLGFLLAGVGMRRHIKRSKRVARFVAMSPTLEALAHSNVPVGPNDVALVLKGKTEIMDTLMAGHISELNDIMFHLADIAMIRHCLIIEWLGDGLRISSSKELTRTHFVSFDVTMSADERRNAGALVEWYDQRDASQRGVH
ncbi:hypothetical protein NKI80_25250 [Mesorhizobium sp. M0387]|uniref:hypothetical protein n=1 Tax=Mesorhizobium sp. M0387 TaxID=2956940 RepID=UPI003334E058